MALIVGKPMLVAFHVATLEYRFVGRFDGRLISQSVKSTFTFASLCDNQSFRAIATEMVRRVLHLHHPTMGRMTINETRRLLGHSLVRSSARSFARTAHSFACSALHALLTRSTALNRSLAHSLAPELVGQWNIFVQFAWSSETL